MEFIKKALSDFFENGMCNSWANDTYANIPLDIRRDLLNCSKDSFINRFDIVMTSMRLNGQMSLKQRWSLICLFDEARSFRR